MCPRLHSVSCGLFVPAPALGAAEHRPAAVHSLSPACIRHPSCAGTDPDACHQCSTGMCPRDKGLQLGTSQASGWKGWSAHNSVSPCDPSARATSTPCIFIVHPKAQLGALGRWYSQCLCYHVATEGGTKQCKAGKSPGAWRKPDVTACASDQKKHFDRLPHCQDEFPFLKRSSCVFWHILYPLESSLRFF